MSDFVRRLGLLRVLLLSVALLSAVSMLWVDTSLPLVGWDILRAAVLPALAPIIFMVLMLDVLMCQVLKADDNVSELRRRDLVFVTKIHLLAATVLLLSWLPPFLRATAF